MDRYAVVGNPVQHSKSPRIHQHFAEETKQDLSYEKILIPIGEFERYVSDFFQQGGAGLNVTVPFKEEAYRLCHKLSQRAKKAGAVNTLLIGKDGLLYGDNTDGAGLVRDIEKNHGVSLANKRILVLGAGGAVRGVMEPLLAAAPKSITIANRTLSKAEELAALFDCQSSGYESLEGVYDVIINGTSASLGGEMPPLPNGILNVDSWCYDMMYGAEPTVFLKWAMSKGAMGTDGLGMLVEQAAEAFYLWRHCRPATEPVIQLLRQSL